MAWIESHQELAHHPKVARLAGVLNVSVPAAIGHLHCLWWWCLSYADDGDLTEFSDFELAHAAQWQGEPDVFVEALRVAGWLDDNEIHDWHEYGGKLAERRRQDAERKRLSRSKSSAGRPPDVREDGVRRQHNTTEDNTTFASAASNGFTAFNAKRAVEAVKERERKGLPVKSVAGLARTIQADADFVEESKRIYAHKECERCRGSGFTEEYAPGAGTRKVECAT